MSQNQLTLSNQAVSQVVPGDSKSINTIIEVPSPLNISFDLNNPTVIKLLEQGGFIVFLLVLCLFFWILTRFVEAVKKE